MSLLNDAFIPKIAAAIAASTIIGGGTVVLTTWKVNGEQQLQIEQNAQDIEALQRRGEKIDEMYLILKDWERSVERSR